MYEICIFYLQSDDNRILIASLECLQMLFKLMPFKFHLYITRQYQQQATTSNNEAHFSPSFLTKFYDQQQQQHQQSRSLQPSQLTAKLSGSMDSLNTLKPIGSTVDDTKSIDEQIELPHPLSVDPSSAVDKSLPPALYQPIKSTPNSAGSFYDSSSPPAVYFTRLICQKFLLNKNYNKTNNDHLTKLKSDSEVKVIVKSVALDCCSSIIALCPYILFKPLKKRNQSEEDEETTCSIYIYDLINYVHHSDDKMRTTTCQLIGQLISSVLAETNGGSYNQWLLKMLKKSRHNDTEDENAELVRVGQFLRMESLVNHLLTFARSDNPSVSNNMCKRFALSSMHAFLPSLFKTRHASLALDILTSLVHLKNSAYNLVKSELVDLIASIDFKAVVYVENSMAAATALASQRRRKRSFGDNSSIKNNNSDYESNSDEDDENNSDDSSNSDEDDDYEAANQRFCPLLLRHTQERLVTDVYLHLLSTEDAKLRLETARCLTRFIANMSMNGGCASANQNVLMAVGESSL